MNNTSTNSWFRNPLLISKEPKPKNLYLEPPVSDQTMRFLAPTLLFIPAAFTYVTVTVPPQSVNSIPTEETSNKFLFGTLVDEEYDFVIVGSGSAGSVLANRLSENPNWKILLLEAGTKGNVLTSVPFLAPAFQLTPYNWGYAMEKQAGACLAMEDNRCAWPRGRALGGSTVINYVIYTRGNPEDFRRWEAQGKQIKNLSSQAYNTFSCRQSWLVVQGCFTLLLKIRGLQLGQGVPEQVPCQGWLLKCGLPVRFQADQSLFSKQRMEPVGHELGEKLVDYNSAKYMGFGQIQANLKHGRRHSASAAFLDPVTNRSNLDIVTSARVTKILIDPSTKEAFGVEFYYKKTGEKYAVKARKEVVLSAGTFHSPQLLMLSGVGPKDQLQKFGIPLVQDLPVGKTLYDHVAYLPLIFTINQTIVPSTQALEPTEALNWIFRGTGFLTSLGGVEALAYIKTNASEEHGNYPDIELLLASIGSLQYDFGLVSRPELRVRQEVYDTFFKPLELKPCFSFLPMMLHPKSKGYLELRSPDPFDQPMLYGNYFTDPTNHDVKTLVSAIRYSQKLVRTKAFQQYGARLYQKHVPGCENYIFDSDEYWECGVRHMSISLHHQVSTCKMGKREDPEAVVDHRLRVYGVKRLRVVDTSVIPVTLSAHTSAPGMMIGEKAADFIKEDWGALLV
ncbi:hypothetical protein NQ315_002324 [Exocentrus adspersus]|uniref:Glucose-methanol-choline oxidoreductase N-terminal domain-containing protein n=1 Tax=Exocentrus adspersus TaxID=1586481 RepID=A0AAV8VUB0_9CUCU|nr:hypothetical protein NQ315_002324 [Exocentrus adspersus]